LVSKGYTRSRSTLKGSHKNYFTLQNPMKDKWNERYSAPDYVYGTEPNEFFKEQLSKLPPGRLLLPGEGEGRNAVYAATRGWKVDAYDFSEQAVRKAQNLAQQKNVNIHYTVSSYEDYKYPLQYYDAAGLIYTHMPPDIRSPVHKKIIRSLKPGGILILEAFHKEQINYSSGGPKDIDMLYDEKELTSDFEGLQVLLLEKKKIHLQEGTFHSGDAVVLRFVGKIVS